jgi:Fe-S cluster biogenesis protein NfuA
LVTLSAQHRQEAEVAAAEEHERAAVETTAMVARAGRLVMAELTVARAEVEAVAVVDATHVAAVEFEALCGSCTSSSVSADSGTDDELKQVREAAREKVA